MKSRGIEDNSSGNNEAARHSSCTAVLALTLQQQHQGFDNFAIKRWNPFPERRDRECKFTVRQCLSCLHDFSFLVLLPS
ncbi:hypothetical protein WJX84_011479 [Apatococcus fuscideae]|uniref:Uncharacterized protein n=1 Tax=Apatococcus fuscideae TaxID=2026836 RepID=A0AAW1SMJ8_9CHLO